MKVPNCRQKFLRVAFPSKKKTLIIGGFPEFSLEEAKSIVEKAYGHDSNIFVTLITLEGSKVVDEQLVPFGN